MQSRAARLTLLILFIVALGVTAFLYWRSDRQATEAIATARTFDSSARAAARTLLDVRGNQQAYVAPGQGGDFWTARVSEGIESLRRALTALRADAVSPEARTALDASRSVIEDFFRLDRRAVDNLRNNQRITASDLIFADGLELSDAALTSLEQARTAEAASRDATIDTFKRRQLFALFAAAAAAILVVLLMLPGAQPERLPSSLLDRSAPPSSSARVIPAPRGQEGETWSPARRAAAHAAPAAEPKAAPAPETPRTPDMVSEPPAAAEAASRTPEPATDFGAVASLCSDLARVVDTRALPSLLERAANVLDASGIILWIADPDGRELNPIFAQGYPPQLVNRLGTIPRDAPNATAAAFRTSLLQTVRADSISDGAIAAPLVTPGGCVGVMAAEVRHDGERQDTTLAAATIVAAQLATLVGPPSARSQARVEATGA
jgi:CHASE3 domain sensor protein